MHRKVPPPILPLISSEDEASDYKILTLVHKALHGNTPSDTIDMLQTRKMQRKLRSSCSDCTFLVELRTSCVTFGDQAFSAYAPKIWNRLPGHLKDCTQEQIRSLLKTYLLQQVIE